MSSLNFRRNKKKPLCSGGVDSRPYQGAHGRDLDTDRAVSKQSNQEWPING